MGSSVPPIINSSHPRTAAYILYILDNRDMAIARSYNLLVTMKYRELIPVTRRSRFEEKVQDVSKKLNEAWRRKKARRSIVTGAEIQPLTRPRSCRL